MLYKAWDLQKLNLKKCEDTVIGVDQLGIKCISCGERIRLAFAYEVINIKIF